MKISYLGASDINGSLLTIETPAASPGREETSLLGRAASPGREETSLLGRAASYGERAMVYKDGEPTPYNAQVVSLTQNTAQLQVFEGTTGFSLTNVRTQLTGKPFQLGLSLDMLGRTFDGLGSPIDDLGPIVPDVMRDIDTPAINPQQRDYPRGFVQTGISGIDLLVSLVQGQKLPIFSTEGLPHDELALQIVRQASTEDSYIVFAGIGLKFDTYQFFKQSFEALGNNHRLVTFLNLALSPVAERLQVPKVALTTAEYLAFDHGKDVIVIMTDMTAYCEALRELSATRGEIPGRKGYPSYMYSQLSTIYERAGVIKGRSGSVTLVPMLTMPAGDITHPIPDLTGFITEGQIVLSKTVGVYPPISILPSLSRLMKDAIGTGKTVANHPPVAKAIFAHYAKTLQTRDLAQIIGEEELSAMDKNYLAFGRAFEQTLLAQERSENRTIAQTVSMATQLLADHGLDM